MEIENIIWKPQQRQEEFLRRNEYEVLYGGAAGGGKSDAMVIEALRQVDNPNYKGIIFRKTFPQLRELILKSLRYYTPAYPNAQYNSTDHCWKFPSGARIYFGSMPNHDSYINYQGLSYSFIGFDELTHFTQEEYEYLISRNRADGDGLRVYIRSTANPGGIGHGWVKDRFIEGKEPDKTYTYKNKILTPEGKSMEVSRTRCFVPSSVFDNEALLKNDPNYLSNLGMLPEAQKKALLYGDWNSFSGQVFTEWRNNPEGAKNRKYTHVIEPFVIPDSWRRYRSFDFGYAKPFAVQWWAIDYDGRAYLYRQLYGCTDTPNTGIKKQPREIAKMIREIEDTYEKGHKITGIADPSIWDESRGSDGTVIRMMEAEGVYFEKGKNDRLSGKMQMHYRLEFDNEGLPMMYVFNTCTQFIRTLPLLVYDDINVEDVNSALEDHDYDAARYFLMANPIKPNREKTVKSKEWNPLE